MLDAKDLEIARLRAALGKFADPDFYVKEKPIDKKPGIIFNIVELQRFALTALFGEEIEG